MRSADWAESSVGTGSACPGRAILLRTVARPERAGSWLPDASGSKPWSGAGCGEPCPAGSEPSEPGRDAFASGSVGDSEISAFSGAVPAGVSAAWSCGLSPVASSVTLPSAASGRSGPSPPVACSAGGGNNWMRSSLRPGLVEKEKMKSSEWVRMNRPSGVMAISLSSREDEKSGILGLRSRCQKLQGMGTWIWVRPLCLGSAAGRADSNLKTSSSPCGSVLHASVAPWAAWTGRRPRRAARSQVRLAGGRVRTGCCKQELGTLS